MWKRTMTDVTEPGRKKEREEAADTGGHPEGERTEQGQEGMASAPGVLYQG